MKWISERLEEIIGAIDDWVVSISLFGDEMTFTPERLIKNLEKITKALQKLKDEIDAQ